MLQILNISLQKILCYKVTVIKMNLKDRDMNEIKIPNKKLKSEGSYKIFSVRIPVTLYDKISELTMQTELSRNEIITILLSGAIDIAVVTEVNK